MLYVKNMLAYYYQNHGTRIMWIYTVFLLQGYIRSQIKDVK